MQFENKCCEACQSSLVVLKTIRLNLKYWICEACGHCQIQSIDSFYKDFENAQRAYFSYESSLLQPVFSPSDKEILAQRQLTANRYLVPDSTVLEVGPGSGIFATWLNKNGYSLRLVEHSVVLARDLENRTGLAIDVGEFEKMDIPAESVDAFCSFHVIEHVAEPLLHLRTGFRASRPGGIGLIATPNAMSWQQRMLPRLSPNFDAAHLRVFSISSLCGFCKEAGWEIVQVRTPEYTSSWLRLLSKTLRRLKGEDEVATAGKYAAVTSMRLKIFYMAFCVITAPLRLLQTLSNGGNEILVILRKPDAPGSLLVESDDLSINEDFGSRKSCS
ncbi:MAG: class I SAM-dependent methyltransferase [Gammaproteobacteria bacterium]|jgi:2-polyprenyl-3-methyl-5-hydroxy-6-metoxy-1,4-benzoquinol methylase